MRSAAAAPTSPGTPKTTRWTSPTRTSCCATSRSICSPCCAMPMPRSCPSIGARPQEEFLHTVDTYQKKARQPLRPYADPQGRRVLRRSARRVLRRHRQRQDRSRKSRQPRDPAARPHPDAAQLHPRTALPPRPALPIPELPRHLDRRRPRQARPRKARFRQDPAGARSEPGDLGAASGGTAGSRCLIVNR